MSDSEQFGSKHSTATTILQNLRWNYSHPTCSTKSVFKSTPSCLRLATRTTGKTRKNNRNT